MLWKPEDKDISRKGKVALSIAMEQPRRMRTEKRPLCLYCVSSFFMPGKQLIQKGSAGLKGTRKKVNLMPEAEKEH